MSCLGERTWREVHESGRPVLILPLGSCEQHGPHLPLDTDTRVAVALAQRLAARAPDLVIAPALAYGSSGEHTGFAGTLSLGQDALEHALLELVRSADAFAGVVIVNGHGGNAEPVSRAVQMLTSEGRRVLAWTPTTAGGDAHAGRTETAILLTLDPSAVRPVGVWELGVTVPLGQLLPMLKESGVAAVSPNGVLGDPTGATADEGADVLDALTDELVDTVERWRSSW